MTTALFTPIKLGASLLKHRIALAPLTRRRSDEDHISIPLMTEYYAQRATDGGLLITEGVFISEESGAYPHVPGIFTDKQIESWKEVTKAVHDKGGIIYLQLWAVGRANESANIPGNKLPGSASAIAIRGKNDSGEDYEVPRALETEEIPLIVEQYAQAARNSIAAGFDGVEIHSANGYLLDQFLNSSSNVRTDKYGGSAENRARFTLEVVESVSKAIGADRTGVRFSPWSGYKDVIDAKPYETWGYVVEQLQENYPDLAYLHFIEPRDDFISGLHPEVDRTEILENDSIDPFRKVWKGPFITAGGYTTHPKRAFETAELMENTLVAFGRSFIANPDLVHRIKNDLPLNKYDRSTFFTLGSVGYTDYPFHDPETADNN